MVKEEGEKPEEKKKEPEPEPDLKYLAVRYIECFCVAVFIFGFVWNGTEMLDLTPSQFMMLYGGTGAVVTEILARIFSRKKKQK